MNMTTRSIKKVLLLVVDALATRVVAPALTVGGIAEEVPVRATAAAAVGHHDSRHGDDGRARNFEEMDVREAQEALIEEIEEMIEEEEKILLPFVTLVTSWC